MCSLSTLYTSTSNSELTKEWRSTSMLINEHLTLNAHNIPTPTKNRNNGMSAPS